MEFIQQSLLNSQNVIFSAANAVFARFQSSTTLQFNYGCFGQTCPLLWTGKWRCSSAGNVWFEQLKELVCLIGQTTVRTTASIYRLSSVCLFVCWFLLPGSLNIIKSCMQWRRLVVHRLFPRQLYSKLPTELQRSVKSPFIALCFGIHPEPWLISNDPAIILSCKWLHSSA